MTLCCDDCEITQGEIYPESDEVADISNYGDGDNNDLFLCLDCVSARLDDQEDLNNKWGRL